MMIQKIHEYKGLQESYCLPSCADMIDPFYNLSKNSPRANPQGLFFTKQAQYSKEWAQWRETSAHIRGMGGLLGPVNSLFDVYSEIKDMAEKNE